jgi:hypothetical protein
MEYKTLKEIASQLEFCEYTTLDQLHDLKMNAAFIKLKELAETNYILTDLKVGDNVFVMISNQPTEVIITNIVINYGTVSEGISFTTKLKYNNSTWFDGGKHFREKLFRTKEDLLNSFKAYP